MNNNTGLMNQAVHKPPQTEKRPKKFSFEPTPMERIAALAKPKTLLHKEKHRAALVSDPENRNGNALLRQQSSLPAPNNFQYGRAQGGISNIELEKLGIGTVRSNRTYAPKRILPKKIRDDPFSDPPPINASDMNDGMFELVNRGIIPRDVDVSPAFDRGGHSLSH